jgi:hypothetical protein
LIEIYGIRLSMKISRLIIIVLMVSILGLSTWNTMQLNRCKKRLVNQKVESQQQFKKVEKAFIESQIASMTYLNRELSWCYIKKIYPAGDFQLELSENPKLLLILSEFSCNVCQDDETKFALEILAAFGENYVLAIVQAGNTRYVNTYIRLNQVDFPVYYVEDDTFFEVNEIHHTPLVLVIDKDNRIIAAHLPVPGHPEYSEPIHRFCRDYLTRCAYHK